MLRRTPYRLSGLNVPSGEDLDKQILLNRLRSRPDRGKYSIKALTATRLQGWVTAGAIVLGAAVFLGPWLWGEIKEMLGGNVVMADPSQMPRTSPAWWENEWRSMNALWRAGESTSDFFVAPYTYVKQQTGRDLSSARAFRASAPGAGTPLRKSDVEQSQHTAAEPGDPPTGSGGFWTSLMRRRRDTGEPTETSLASAHATSPAVKPAVKNPPRALVPLCGDSPIVKTLALQGFEVDAVDASETAIRACVQRTEDGLPADRFAQVHLHWHDIFSADLWEKEMPNAKFDVIYERQGMTSLNREQRPDYAYLLRRALKDDGVLYVEGIFRTGRVKGNKWHGPPYTLSKKDLETLFPSQDGYFVRCEEKSDGMRRLSREDRVLKRVPKSLYVTPFHCVVFKEAAVRLDNRNGELADYDASERLEAVSNWQDTQP